MAEGDALFFDDDLVHTVRNAGDEPTVLLISAFLEASEPPVIFHKACPCHRLCHCRPPVVL
jgi:hypothetical protein